MRANLVGIYRGLPGKREPLKSCNGSSMFVILFLTLVVLSHAGDTVLFAKVGKTADTTSVGHLVVNIDLRKVYEAHDKVEDMVKTISKQLSNNSQVAMESNMYLIRRQYPILVGDILTLDAFLNKTKELL